MPYAATLAVVLLLAAASIANASEAASPPPESVVATVLPALEPLCAPVLGRLAHHLELLDRPPAGGEAGDGAIAEAVAEASPPSELAVEVAGAAADILAKATALCATEDAEKLALIKGGLDRTLRTIGRAARRRERASVAIQAEAAMAQMVAGGPVMAAPGTWLGRLLEKLDSLVAILVSDALEEEVLVAADRAIDRHRTSEALVRVRNADGSKAAGVPVRIRQVSSDVRFGANIYLFEKTRSADEQAAYRARFAELFNFATTDFYWRRYEPERGKPFYDYTARVAAWCGARGIALKGHPILWDHTSGQPNWAVGRASAAMQEQRVNQLMRRFAGQIVTWDVVNEPAHTRFVVDDAFRWARAADPEAELVVNDYGVFGDGYPAYFEMIAGMNERGVPFDAVGIQGHGPLHHRYPLASVRDHLRRYAELGKPIHITELTPSSGGQTIEGSPFRGTWNEVLQADYTDKLYRVLFAERAVDAISWWDLSDQQAWQKGSGLLREDMSPKPAFEALHRLLLERWRTTVDAETDAAGELRFRGYHGRYRVEVGGVEREVRVRRGGLNMYSITLE